MESVFTCCPEVRVLHINRLKCERAFFLEFQEEGSTCQKQLVSSLSDTSQQIDRLDQKSEKDFILQCFQVFIPCSPSERSTLPDRVFQYAAHFFISKSSPGKLLAGSLLRPPTRIQALPTAMILASTKWASRKSVMSLLQLLRPYFRRESDKLFSSFVPQIEYMRQTTLRN